MKSREFSLQQAADALGLSRIALIRQLELLRVVEHDGQFGIRPTKVGMANGHLRYENRVVYVNGAFAKHYHRTTVTVQGLAWIERKLQEALPRVS